MRRTRDHGGIALDLPIRMPLRFLFTLLFSAHLGGTALPARTPVVVAVAEEGSGAPIAGAQVYFPELRMAVWTDWLGEAKFDDVPVGTHRVRVRRLGYAPSETRLIVGRELVGPVFMLEKLPPSLDTVRVRAAAMPSDVNLLRMTWRQQMGIGRFITDSVLLANRSGDLNFLFREKLPGLSAVPGLGSLTQFSSGRGCQIMIYIDDQWVPGRQIPKTDWWEFDLFPITGPADLAGVEYYHGGTAPPQYRRPIDKGDTRSLSAPRHDRDCQQVILLWSRWR